MKKLEEMSLIDDFLMNSLTSHPVYGREAMKYILGCIFQRNIGELSVIPQNFLVGADPEAHGVRLDVYLDEEDGEIFDVEPDLSDGARERKSLPRRVRFYHAKIDAGILEAGKDYDSLRNVSVIFISDYDPFGQGRMVYTIKNGVIEEPDMPYDDGTRTIFLYTKGTKGNPPKELQELLRYLGDSRWENATSKELQKLHHMVTEVKHDGKVGLAYMKSFERDKRLLERGREEGEALGRAEERQNTERERARAEASEAKAKALEDRIQELEKMIVLLKNA